jgi:3-oxoacyl-[acyl-carrier-protein] synthase-3
MGASITGYGWALPSRVMRNVELGAPLGLSDEWIYERTGIRSRHVAGAGETTSSLAIEASASAIESAGLDPLDIDMVIVATSTPDFQLPATASIVQGGLGCLRAGSFDINAACAGFLYALAQADALIDNGSCDCVLVCGSEILTRITDFSDPKTCVLFGDGAGAVVVQRAEGSLVGPFSFHSEGGSADLLYVHPEERLIRMDGREVYRRAVETMSRSVSEIVDASGLSIDEVDAVIAHQANGRILEAMASRLGIDLSKFVIDIETVGNTSAASIPIALARAAGKGRFEPGDVIVLTAIGAGFTWGAGLMSWGVRTTSKRKSARLPALVGTIGHLLEVT